MRSFLSALLFLLFSCHASDPKKADGSKKDKNKSVSIQVLQAEVKIFPRLFKTTSLLTGISQADVYSKVPGRISYLGPKEGSPVQTQDVLFRVDRSDPGESFLTTPILSPIKGWVGRWMVTNLGSQITPQEAVVTIVDDSSLKATIYLPTKDWLLVNPETQVTVKVNDEIRLAKIEAIARAAEFNSGRGSVTILVANENHTWRVGLSGEVEFSLDPRERMLLPATAVSITDKGDFVFIIDNGVPKRIPIQFSVVDNDTIEVTKGLSRNAQVVIAGNNLLSEQSTVKIVEAQKETVHATY